MSTEIAKNQNQIVATDYNKIATEYLTSMGLKLPQKYQVQFLELAKAFGLNPFKREIYAVGYGDNYNIITGYEVYLKRAERTGKLDGWNVTIEGKVADNSLRANIEIFRKDWSHSFKHTVFYAECLQKTKTGQPTSIWQKMPVFMTKKVAIAQGFRLCFSDEFGGMPYTADEIMEEPEVVTTATVIETSTQQPAQQPQQMQQVDQEKEAAKKRMAELKATGVFTNEELEYVINAWKTDWKKALADMEEAYKLKTTQPESQQAPF